MMDEPATLLVVDDSRSKRYVVSAWLRRAGHQVREASTGEETLERIREEPIDLVVLDVGLPDMNGFQVCERIKSDPRTRSLPVIHLSATAVQSTDRTEGLVRGADAYLVEPVDPDELLATVRAVLRYSRARREAERMASRLAMLAEATLAVNMATTFDGLLSAAATGAARIFKAPAVALAITAEGQARAARVDGPDGAARVGTWRGGYPGGVGPHEAPVGVRVHTEPATEWRLDGCPGASPDVWVAAARPKDSRPAAYVAVPTGFPEVRDDTVLTQLAQAVALAVEAMRAYDEERRIALTLQRSLLPRRLPEIPGYDLAVRYSPINEVAEVGGDFYEVAWVDDGLLLAIGDVAGHSLHAATVMAELRHALRAYATAGDPPATVLDRLNTLMLRLIPGEVATVCLVYLDPPTGALRVANAGHVPPLLSHRGRSRMLRVGGPLLGIPLDRPEPAVAVLRPGDSLTLFTDGLVERRGERLHTGLRRLVATAATVDASLETYCDRLLDELAVDCEDDVALLVVRRRG